LPSSINNTALFASFRMASVLQKLTSLHEALGPRYVRMDDVLARLDSELFRCAPSVSNWSVANQLHHLATSTALMLTGVSRIGSQTIPAEASGSVTAIGRAVLMTRRFPRGKGKAPKRTVPPDEVSRADLEKVLARSRRTYERLPAEMEAVAASSWKVAHPFFGMLEASQWMKLAAIHADHHFRIIEDIDAV
jgi:hypothetical protein